MIKKRASGILLHITSLPSRFGIGDLGPAAFRFADFLKKAKQSYWQVLPLNPPVGATSGSPYTSRSAFAGNTLLISPELLYRDGRLTKKEIQSAPSLADTAVDYRAVAAYKDKLLSIAYERFAESGKSRKYEQSGRLPDAAWLEDFATFLALRQHFGGRSWCDWPSPVRDRKPQALKGLKSQLRQTIDKQKFLQYVFSRQWLSLRNYCNKLGIRIIGDVPFYVAYDSADVWTNPQNFKLNKAKKPRMVCGVPPDYFSATGQLWGNPAYDWNTLKKARYHWMVQRIRHNLKLFDILRLDHFRGFAACWEVPATEKTAVKGKWVPGPKEDFFNTLVRDLGALPMIAEDLGFITPEVTELLDKFQLPGMKVLLFGFGQSCGANPHLPHNFEKNCVVYTGTHDNNTIRGWFQNEAKRKDKQRLFDYLGRGVPDGRAHTELIRLAMASVAQLVILPLQDVLGLGQDARMNRPAARRGNWRWRFTQRQLTPSIIKKLAEMTKTYGRT